MNILNTRRVGMLIAMGTFLAAGLSTGVKIYYLIFFVLLAMAVLGAVSALWTLYTVRFDMKGVRSRVVRGDTLMTIFTVRHTCLLPVSGIRLRMSVPSAGAADQEVAVTTPPFALRTFRHMIRCPHRGLYEFGVSRVSVTDVFGLFTFSRKPGMKMMRMEVQPKAADIPAMPLKSADMGPECMSRATEDNASPSDVRKWQDGDVLKKVHWKLSLRKREIMVRTYEESARPDTLVIPDMAEIAALRDQQLTIEDCICEECLSAAKAQLEAGYPVRMPLTGLKPQEVAGQFPADIPAFTDALMRAKFDSPYGYEQVLMLMMNRLQRTGGAILVTARLSTRIADIAMRMQKSGIQTKLVWVTDDAREESLAMLERVRMAGVITRRQDPWQTEKPRPAGNIEDDYDI
ncbi:MAG: DUF58 domain-containing protein [Clostridiales bacterium]|nr:DUF58 domain-containing protein [Clostridiales bacterium]